MQSTSPSDWTLVKVRSSFGCKSPFAPIYYDNKVLFPAMQNDKFIGFAAITGSSIDPSTTLLTVSAMASELKSDVIEPDMFDIAEAYVPGISATVYRNKAYITVPYGSSQIYNNRIYVFDFSLGLLSENESPSWAPWTGLNASHFAIYDGKLHYANADSAGSFIYEMNTSTYDDDGAAIDSYFWTKEFSGIRGEENNTKDFRAINLFRQLSGDYYMDLAYRLDSANDEGTTETISLAPGGAVWRRRGRRPGGQRTPPRSSRHCAVVRGARGAAGRVHGRGRHSSYSFYTPNV
jgi:hypothetical protein